jgi:hypothetical protein
MGEVGSLPARIPTIGLEKCAFVFRNYCSFAQPVSFLVIRSVAEVSSDGYVLVERPR